MNTWIILTHNIFRPHYILLIWVALFERTFWTDKSGKKSKNLKLAVWCTLAMALSRCLTSANWRLWLDRIVLMESTSSCRVSPQVSSCCSRSSWFLCSMLSSSSRCLWAQLSQSGLPIGKSGTALCSNEKHEGNLLSFPPGIIKKMYQERQRRASYWS